MQINIQHTMLIERYGERFILDANACLYWKRKRWLIISDLHLGKSMHFRKKGMAVPKNIDALDISLMRTLISKYKPHKVILLGDLFHSDYNSEWERFAQFTCEYRKNLFVLVRGNHDILPDWHYGRARMELLEDIKIGPFWMTHIPEKHPGVWINICGHLHPGIRLHGRARQTMRMPAFFFRNDSILVPAFGRFTGSVSIKPKASDQVVAIVGGELVSV